MGLRLFQQRLKLSWQRLIQIRVPSSSSVLKNKSSDSSPRPQYDAQLAGEACRAGCAALAAGKLDEALYSLNISLSKCRPDKTNAVAKLLSLIAPTSQQLHKSPIWTTRTWAIDWRPLVGSLMEER